MLENIDSPIEEKYKIPCGPGFRVVIPPDNEKVDEDTQKCFRSKIGSLLYLVKLSRPDLNNAVRELSKIMDGATPGQVKELKRLLIFVSKTREKGLKMELSRENSWEIEAYSDSDFGGDKDGRKSISGLILCKWSSYLLEIKWAKHCFIVKHRSRVHCSVRSGKGGEIHFTGIGGHENCV
jgi:hypothetical protein